MTAMDRRSFLCAAGYLVGEAVGIGAIVSPAFGQAGSGSAIPMTLGEAKGAGQSAQFMLGAKGGFFRKRGLDVSVKVFGSGAQMGPALVAGSLNIIATGDIPAIPIMAAGAPIKALCPLSDFSADQAIVVRGGIKQPADLIGKKIALYKGSVATLFIERYATQHKLDINKISLIHMDAAQQLTAMASGEIDGYVSWEPFIWNGTHKIPNAHVLARANDAPGYMQVFDLLLVRSDFLKANQKAVQRLLAGLADAMDQLKANKSAVEHAATYIREVQGVDIPVDALSGMITNRIYTMTISKELVNIEKVNTEFLHRLGRIKTKPDVMSWLDPEPLRSVRPDLVTI